METAVMLGVGAVGAVVDCGLAYLGWTYWRRYRRIVDTPTSAVKSLRDGFAEVKGRVVCLGEPLSSPLAKARCVHFRFRVTERRKRGKHHHTVTVVDHQQHVPFGVDDGTGVVRVDPREAELHLATDVQTSSGFLSDAPPELEHLLQSRYGASSQGLIFNKSMRYTETSLGEGDHVYVLGPVEARSGQQPRFTSRSGERPFVSDSSEKTLTSTSFAAAVGLWALAGLLLVGGIVFACVLG